MKKSENIANLELLAASQWGMFTTAQAQELGVRRNQVSRLTSANRTEMMCYGVYRFVAGAEAEQSDIKAAWLSVFPQKAAHDRLKERPFDAVIAGRSAACALGAGVFRTTPYTFLLSRRRQTSREDVKYFFADLDEQDVILVDGIPTTSFERTVYDLIRLAEDPSLIDDFMRDAATRAGHTFDRDRLGALLAPLAESAGFGRGNGIDYADDLIARNTADVQLEKINEAFGALSPVLEGGSLDDYPGIEAGLKELAKALAAIHPSALKVESPI